MVSSEHYRGTMMSKHKKRVVMKRSVVDPEDHAGKVQCTRSFVYKETSGDFRLARLCTLDVFCVVTAHGYRV